MNRLFGRRVVLAIVCSYYFLLIFFLIFFIIFIIFFIFVMVFYRFANACPPEAAATHAVEEATRRTNFESILAFSHTFATINRPYFISSTSKAVRVMLLLAY